MQIYLNEIIQHKNFVDTYSLTTLVKISYLLNSIKAQEITFAKWFDTIYNLVKQSENCITTIKI